MKYFQGDGPGSLLGMTHPDLVDIQIGIVFRMRLMNPDGRGVFLEQPNLFCGLRK
jgi:hypothetical protein